MVECVARRFHGGSFLNNERTHIPHFHHSQQEGENKNKSMNAATTCSTAALRRRRRSIKEIHGGAEATTNRNAAIGYTNVSSYVADMTRKHNQQHRQESFSLLFMIIITISLLLLLILPLLSILLHCYHTTDECHDNMIEPAGILLVFGICITSILASSRYYYHLYGRCSGDTMERRKSSKLSRSCGVSRCTTTIRISNTTNSIICDYDDINDNNNNMNHKSMDDDHGLRLRSSKRKNTSIRSTSNVIHDTASATSGSNSNSTSSCSGSSSSSGNEEDNNLAIQSHHHHHSHIPHIDDIDILQANMDDCQSETSEDYIFEDVDIMNNGNIRGNGGDDDDDDDDDNNTVDLHRKLDEIETELLSEEFELEAFQRSLQQQQHYQQEETID